MVIRACLAAAVIAVLSGPAVAQSCTSLSGGSTCPPLPKGGNPIDFSKPSYDPRGGNNYVSAFSGSNSSGLGNELSGYYAPTTFGAFTVGAGGGRCSGLFRSRSC